MITYVLSPFLRRGAFIALVCGAFTSFAGLRAQFVDVNTTRGLDNAVFFSAVPPRTRAVSALFPHARFSDAFKGLVVDFAFEKNEDLTPLLKEIMNKEIMRHLISEMAKPEIASLDPKLYDLLSPFTAQERKLAMQLSCGGIEGALVWNVTLPFVFIERNVWLEEQNQWEIGQIISNNPKTSSVNSAGGEDSSFGLLATEAQKFTFLAGPGNTILSVGARKELENGVEGIAGVRGIVPTSALAGKRLLNNDLDITISEKNVKELKTLFAAFPQYRAVFNVGQVLPRIRQIALNPLDTVPPAWGMGLFFEGKTSFLEGTVDFWSRIECDYYYPITVDRLVLVNQPISSDAPKIFDNAYVPATLPLQLPFQVRAVSRLGITGHAVQGVTLYFGEKGSWAFGYDFHHQAGERLEVRVSDEIKSLMATSVDIGGDREGPIVLGVAPELSQKRRLTQQRVFTHVRVEGFFSDTTSLAIGGDYALSSGGTGPSWALYTRMNVDF